MAKYQTATGAIVDAFRIEENLEFATSEFMTAGDPGDYLVIKGGFIRLVDKELFALTFKPIDDKLEAIVYEREVLASLEEFEASEKAEKAGDSVCCCDPGFLVGNLSNIKHHRHPYEVLSEQMDTEDESRG